MKKVEVRRVAVNWEHPKGNENSYIPLRDGISYSGRVKLFEDGLLSWNQEGNKFYRVDDSYEEWAGPFPVFSEHMPNWPEKERTMLIMYDVSENDGVPISPSFDRPEYLSRWLVENSASFSGYVPDYSEWFEIAIRNDVEDDEWYERTIMIRAAMMAFFVGNEEKAYEIIEKMRAKQLACLPDYQSDCHELE
jgi:hypothetical protein